MSATSIPEFTEQTIEEDARNIYLGNAIAT